MTSRCSPAGSSEQCPLHSITPASCRYTQVIACRIVEQSADEPVATFTAFAGPGPAPEPLPDDAEEAQKVNHEHAVDASWD